MDSETLREVLQDAAREIDRHSDDNIAINRIVESVVTEVTGSESSSVWMNEYPKLIRERKEGVRELSMEEKRGLLYKCFLTKQPAFYNYITSEKGYIPEIDNPDSIRIKSKITIPLSVQDRLIGIVTCYSSVKKIKNYTREDLERFKAITPFVIDAIIRMQANRGNQVIEERRQGQAKDTGQRRRNRIIEKIETLEEQSRETSDASEILEMTSTIVHDIRTPANNLMGFLEILDEQIGDKRLKEYIEHAKKSAALINDLTTSILDSMAERRIREQSRVERVNTLKFFAEVGEIFSATIYEKGLQYNIFIDPRLPKEIALETMKLKRVLMNLLGNAVKFTPENGVIEYSVVYLPETKRLLCTVKDSGIGIPEERQAEIFKPFTQAEDSTRVRFGGSGLGLSVSSEFVREMGGELRLKSQPDRGSVF
ncbi:MAG TPA: GAF domain-containing sensor histidine kinase, partial [Nitratifractor salsuginis]|nr:GAF domain-containing sensor histidine kinase [Nitratifractor salsuginis]